MRANLIDLTGQKFALWTVVEQRPYTWDTMWLCRCECGTERVVSGRNLRAGKTTGCGCTRQHAVKHGQSRRGEKTRTYMAWKAMISRCRPEYVQAADYHDRGITVCDRWRDSFEAFFADMGECPSRLTLDRIDNDGNYEPGNCRWATSVTQRRNSRRIAPVVFGGAELLLKDAAEKIGVSDTAVHQERRRHGGSMQEAFDRVYERVKARGFKPYEGFC